MKHIKNILLTAIATLALTAGIVFAANTFPTTLNTWSDGEVIESGWANALETAMVKSVTKVVCSSDTTEKALCDYVCDGTADDVQIQAALDAVAASTAGRGTVELMEGTFTIDSSISTPDATTLTGQGWGKTILKGGASFTDSIIERFGSLGSPITDVTISNLELDGSDQPTASPDTGRKSIYMGYTLNMKFLNVYAHHAPATCFGNDYNVNFFMDNCIAEQCGTEGENPGYNGFGFGTGKYTDESSVISNCIAIDNKNNGFLFEDVTGGVTSHNYKMTNCVAKGNKIGLRVSGSSNISFVNGTIKDSDSYGVYIEQYNSEDPKNIKIIGNDIYSNADDGIRFQHYYSGLDGAVIADNNIYLNGEYGVITGSNNVQVTDNVLYNNSKDGIYYHAGNAGTRDGVLIQNNLVYNSGQGNIGGSENGIEINGASATINGIIVSGNRCYDNQGTKTQEYGFRLMGNIGTAQIYGNDFDGNGTADIYNNATDKSNISIIDINGNSKIGLNTLGGSDTTTAGFWAGKGTPEASGIIANRSSLDNAIAVYGDGAAYFLGRDVTNDIEFIMGSSNFSSCAFVGSMTAHNFELRANNATKVKLSSSGIDNSILIQEDVGATCTLGELRFDTGGATDELCYCSATNTWKCVVLGALTD